ncbi:MAG TPA: RHS repeat-associated core domain-containing protein [Ktedonosporobacter sp.]|jgi:RHS repeat-associated protein|nr:RHS repeat-associated core domain-containing protein [Ktedonosporobacter sp.]
MDYPPHWSRLSFSHISQILRELWNGNIVLRLSLVFSLTATFVIGCWAGVWPSRVYASPNQQTNAAPVSQNQVVTAPLSSLTSADSWLNLHSTLLPAATSSIDGMGVQRFYTYITDHLSSNMEIKINVGNGNVVLHVTNLHIKGTLLDLSLESYYNSESGPSSEIGPRWQLNTAADVNLGFNSDGTVRFNGPTGNSALFAPDGNGGFVDPPGLDATLFKSGDANTPYHLRYHKTGERLEFNAGGRLVRDEEQNGNGIDFTYDASHRVTTATDTQGRVVTFTYNTAGQLTTITDPSGRAVSYSYDSSGNLISSTDPAGNVTSYAYAPGTSNIVQITDPLGNTTKLTYGGSGGQIRTLTDPTGAVTSFTFNSDDTTVVTDARGNKTTYLHDGSIRITKVTDALGHTQSTTYTPDSNVASFTDPLSNVTTYSYDVNNNMTTASWPTGAKYTYTYDNENLPFYPTTQTDPQGNKLSYTYNGNGDLTQVRDSTDGGTGSTTQYNYNANGTIASMTDPGGNITTYSYDSAGNLIKTTPPSPMGATTLTYDTLSRLTSVTDGKGQTTTYTYDALDRIVKATYADGSSVNYSYDADGNALTESDSTGTTTLRYDAANRLLSKTLPGGNVLSYAYDAVGNPLSFTDAGGTVSYSYNAVNLLTTLTEPGGAQTLFTYNAKDERTSIQYPNNVTIGISYNGAGQQTIINAKRNGTLLAGYSYNYGGKALRQSMTDQATNQQTNYQYDTLNRLTNAGVFNGGTKVDNFHYSYDLRGNIVAQTLGLNGAQVNFTYNAADELVSTSQGVTYSYDANGNRTAVSQGIVTLVYNAMNQTTAINGTQMAYTGADQTQRVQAGTISYVNGPQGISSQSDSSGTTYFTRDAKGQLLSERTPSGTFYYLFDALGSIVGLTDSSGNLVGGTRYRYDPYGNLLSTISSPVLQANPWRYAGGYFDSSSGYDKFGARYYDPAVGRWTQLDPLQGNPHDPTAQNRCAYANEDPVNRTDSSGKASWLDKFGFCMASIPGEILLQVIGGILTAIGAIAGGWAGLIALGALGAAVTAPAWLGPVAAWLALIGASVYLGAVLGCILGATFG